MSEQPDPNAQFWEIVQEFGPVDPVEAPTPPQENLEFVPTHETVQVIDQAIRQENFSLSDAVGYLVGIGLTVDSINREGLDFILTFVEGDEDCEIPFDPMLSVPELPADGSPALLFTTTGDARIVNRISVLIGAAQLEEIRTSAIEQELGFDELTNALIMKGAQLDQLLDAGAMLVVMSADGNMSFVVTDELLDKAYEKLGIDPNDKESGDWHS